MTATAGSPKALQLCAICASPILFIFLLNPKHPEETNMYHILFLCSCATCIPLFFLCFFSRKFSQWSGGGCGTTSDRSSIRNKGRYLTLQVDGIVRSTTMGFTLVFFPAWLQLQDIYFRPFHKYKASRLAGISTVGKGGSTKGDGSGMRFLGVKSSCLKTVKTSMM